MQPILKKRVFHGLFVLHFGKKSTKIANNSPLVSDSRGQNYWAMIYQTGPGSKLSENLANKVQYAAFSIIGIFAWSFCPPHMCVGFLSPWPFCPHGLFVQGPFCPRAFLSAIRKYFNTGLQI